jgi:hypothetical protein
VNWLLLIDPYLRDGRDGRFGGQIA